jgi:hypothetical protein
VQGRAAVSERPRVVVALPNDLESTTIADWLVTEGLEPVRRSTPASALDEMRTHAYDLLIADAEFVFRGGVRAGGRARNPGTPTLIVGDETARLRSESAQWAMFVARPIDRAMLACTVSMAMIDARPARRSERKLVHGFHAVVNGLPSQIIDVSNEGLRLEVPRERHWTPPPFFDVRILMAGVAVRVRRMWAVARLLDNQREVTTCGGALSANRPSTEEAWRAFVHAVPTVTGGSTLQIE